MSTASPTSQVQPWVMSLEDERAFSSADATVQWLSSLDRDEIRPYLGQWIAARDCRVIAFARSFEALLRELNDVDLQTVIVHRFEKPGRVVYR